MAEVACHGDVDWVSLLFSGHFAMCCWHCGSQCRIDSGRKGLRNLSQCSRVHEDQQCPARYCGSTCQELDWKERHRAMCKPMCKAISRARSQTDEAVDLERLVAKMLATQEDVFALEKPGSHDISRYASVMEDIKHMSQGVKVLELHGAVAHFEHQPHFLKSQVARALMKFVLLKMNTPDISPWKWSKSDQRAMIQFQVTAKQVTLPKDYVDILNSIDPLLEVVADVVLGCNDRGLVKLGCLFQAFEIVTEDISQKLGTDEFSSQVPSICSMGGMLAECAAELCHLIAVDNARFVLQERLSALSDSDLDQLNFWVLNVWVAPCMGKHDWIPRAALPGLKLSEKWYRTSLVWDKRAWCCSRSRCSADENEQRAHAALFEAQLKCGLASSRVAFALLYTSGDRGHFEFANCVLGKSMALDLLFQAHSGMKKFAPGAKPAKVAAQAFKTLLSYLQTIISATSKHFAGKRMRFVVQRTQDMNQVLFLDHERSFSGKKGCLPVVLCDFKASTLMQYEKQIGQHVETAEFDGLVTKEDVKFKSLKPLPGALVCTDSSGVFKGVIHNRFPNEMLEAANLEELLDLDSNYTSAEEANSFCSGMSKLQAGVSVTIRGVVCMVELNGQAGVCQRWDAAKGRWHVLLLSSGITKALKPQNLEMKEPE